jgi:hypothetical protein
LVKIFMRRGCSTGVSRRAFSTADATSPTGLKPSRGGEEQNVVLGLMVAFCVIMLWELGERFPQRTFPEQDQMGQAQEQPTRLVSVGINRREVVNERVIQERSSEPS